MSLFWTTLSGRICINIVIIVDNQDAFGVNFKVARLMCQQSSYSTTFFQIIFVHRTILPL
tara:strand:- start:2610 stop:2789 length:180 start_codon:yes stop_codon:yes gene_type:complete